MGERRGVMARKSKRSKVHWMGVDADHVERGELLTPESRGRSLCGRIWGRDATQMRVLTADEIRALDTGELCRACT